jgi:hypothetical protein
MTTNHQYLLGEKRALLQVKEFVETQLGEIDEELEAEGSS